MQDPNAVTQPARHEHFVLRRDDHGFDIGKLFDQLHASKWSEDEDASKAGVSDHGAAGDDGHAPALTRRFAGRRVEDVVISLAVFHEESLIVP